MREAIQNATIKRRQETKSSSKSGRTDFGNPRLARFHLGPSKTDHLLTEN